jgi:hypothetical protein
LAVCSLTYAVYWRNIYMCLQVESTKNCCCVCLLWFFFQQKIIENYNLGGLLAHICCLLGEYICLLCKIKKMLDYFLQKIIENYKSITLVICSRTCAVVCEYLCLLPKMVYASLITLLLADPSSCGLHFHGAWSAHRKTVRNLLTHLLTWLNPLRFSPASPSFIVKLQFGCPPSVLTISWQHLGSIHIWGQ